MNHSDSERIAAVLETAGYKKTLSEDNADLIVINTCSVRQSAVDRISGRFKKYKKLRKENPGLKIVLTGCVLKSDRKKFEKMFDLIVRIGEIEKRCRFHSSVKTVEPNRIPHSGSTRLSPLENQHCNYLQIKPLHQSKFSAYVPIMTGCNNFCTYCVVPYTRGREYSRPAEEVLNEIRDLAKQGYKEIILLGQNVNSYKSKITNQGSRIIDSKFQILDSKTISFPALLKLINAIPGNFWIRFLTSHPKDMSEELIKTVAECKKITPYIHLALQSGDNKILKKMNRKYTAEHFLELVKKYPQEFSKKSLLFWREKVRPVYIYHLFHGLIQAIKEKKEFNWDEVIELMVKITIEEDLYEYEKQDRLEPDWNSVFRAEISLLNEGFSCFTIPFKEREKVWRVIEILSNHPEPDLKYEKKYGGDNMDPATLSINTIRGEAIHGVINYALWCSRNLKKKILVKEAK